MRQVGLRLVGKDADELKRSAQLAMEEIRRALRDMDNYCDNLENELSRLRRNNSLVIPAGGAAGSLTVFRGAVQPDPVSGEDFWLNDSTNPWKWSAKCRNKDGTYSYVIFARGRTI